jgi:hypothetical protein
LWTIAVLIVFSATYAVIVKKDPGLGYAFALGYIALLLTVIVILTCWKKPPHDQ